MKKPRQTDFRYRNLSVEASRSSRLYLRLLSDMTWNRFYARRCFSRDLKRRYPLSDILMMACWLEYLSVVLLCVCCIKAHRNARIAFLLTLLYCDIPTQGCRNSDSTSLLWSNTHYLSFILPFSLSCLGWISSTALARLRIPLPQELDRQTRSYII